MCSPALARLAIQKTAGVGESLALPATLTGIFGPTAYVVYDGWGKPSFNEDYVAYLRKNGQHAAADKYMLDHGMKEAPDPTTRPASKAANLKTSSPSPSPTRHQAEPPTETNRANYAQFLADLDRHRSAREQPIKGDSMEAMLAELDAMAAEDVARKQALETKRTRNTK